MLEKDKNCIEFSMHSMVVTHMPYQKDSEIAITGMIPGREILTADNPFDVPCEVVMVPKREFERLQTANEELKKKLAEFKPAPGYREFLTALYPGEDVDKLVWATEQLCCGRDLRHALHVDLIYYKALSSVQTKAIHSWEQKYEALFKLVGFSSVEEIQDYLTNEAEADTLHEAISKLHDEVKYTSDKWASANWSNNSWKAAAECNSPKELIEKLKCLCGDISDQNTTIESYKRDIEKWQKVSGCSTPEETLESFKKEVSDYKEQIYALFKAIENWKKATGYNEPKDFLKWKANIEESVEAWKRGTGCKYPAEARILLEKWKTLTKCETPEAATTWITSYESACERGNRLAKEIENWKKATGCLRPEDISNESLLVSKCMSLEQEVKTLNGALQEWKEITGCPAPIAAKTLIESGMSYEHGYHEVQEENRKLTDEVKSWQNVTGHATPEDYLTAKILTVYVKLEPSNAAWRDATGCNIPEEAKTLIESMKAALRESNRVMLKELDNNIDEWQKAIGCNTPDDAKKRIEALNERIDESEACYNHLLMLTGFGDEDEVEDALDKCDHSTLRKALVDYEFDYESLLKFTGYKSEHDIRVMLNGEKYQYKTMRELINSLERKVKFTESNWQKATGCDTPGVAEERIKHYKNRLRNAVQAASCATKHLENITF